MEVFEKDGQTYAIVYRNDHWKEGLDFPTPDDMFIQAGCWQYDSGKKLRAHKHKDYERSTMRTQELTYVKSGKMKVTIYTEEAEFLFDFELVKGDFAIMVHGGHGYEILEDKTQVLEVKNGPFISVEKDKDIFHEHN